MSKEKWYAAVPKAYGAYFNGNVTAPPTLPWNKGKARQIHFGTNSINEELESCKK